MARQPGKGSRGARGVVAEPAVAGAGQAASGIGGGDGASGASRPIPPWAECVGLIDALADRHIGLFPCRITHPDGPETHYAPFYGAPVVKGDTFTVLMSDGREVAL